MSIVRQAPRLHDRVHIVSGIGHVPTPNASTRAASSPKRVHRSSPSLDSVMDVAALRAELKAWEREFRTRHSRNPTIEEIKDQPAIAAKYKLYKSLSKSVSSSSLAKASSTRPSTPPRSQSRQTTHTSSSSLLPKARAIKVDPPIQTTNPFSPVKRKPRPARSDSPPVISSNKLSEHASHLNPFTTPTKAKSTTKLKPSAPRRSLSPDPFPLIQASQVTQSPSAPVRTPSSRSAVTRARKRLRGEPVSPSPVKEKRTRVGSQRALNFTTTLLDSDEEDAQFPHADGIANETFLEATPMKPPPGGKSFRVLFDEVLPTSRDASRQSTIRTLSRTASAVPKPNSLSSKRARSRAMSPSSSEDENDEWENGMKLESLMSSANGFHVVKKPAPQPKRPSNGPGKTFQAAVLPDKDDLRAEKGPPRGPAPKDPLPRGKTPSGPVDAISAGRPTGKRPRSDGGDISTGIGAGGLNETYGVDHVPFLPPSPPRPDGSYPRTGIAVDKGKGRASAAFSRKKARLLEQLGGEDIDDDSVGSEDGEGQVKLREHSWNAPRRQAAAIFDELDDPEFQWPAHPPHSPDSPPTGFAAAEEGTMEVNLRDDLRRILALSSQKRTEAEERRLVSAILYGRRESHYDAKGMEVWDVGEMSEGTEGVGDGEDDWEGEPVPWEVGEL
ncbi:hypothetical protein DAEQUDRAFT_20631 [Daedalea quercina L-15889]|uniref:DNA replication regulator SLD2 n=1 Tax=Daedalea quercina L-15889 TaxID=1314783 RepID=A0A165UL83_9APHY|nr:hypothetical protein DAEQUDRAFT_20631 [Daedalea quercina L-15889]